MDWTSITRPNDPVPRVLSIEKLSKVCGIGTSG